MYKDTLQKVKRFMTETGMLQNCSEIILGVSGGPDSMTMLHILNELRDEFGYRLRVVHVNHGIRGKEALRDQQMVEKICSEWKIPCAVYNYDVPALALSWKMGTEEAGRKVRRIAFEKEKENAVAIPEQVRVALAHNQNDMAETMLHHLALDQCGLTHAVSANHRHHFSAMQRCGYIIDDVVSRKMYGQVLNR